MRAAAFALLGEVAESATYVHQRSDDAKGGALELEVATGMLEGDTHFAPHGHVLLLRVTPE